MTRIAFVVEATTGGVARQVIDLLTHLDPAEFSCVLYADFSRPDSWAEHFRALHTRGVELRELPMARVPNQETVRRLVKWARADRIDLLHLHSAKAGYHGRLAAKQAGIPAVYTPHAFPFQRTTDWRRPVYRHIERKLAAHTARIICVSDGELALARAARLPQDRLVRIPNGLDLSRWPLPSAAQRAQARRQFGIDDDEIVIGAVARLAPQKGIDLLIQAGEELLPDYRRVRLMIWGDGPERRELQRLARRLRLRRTYFLGQTEDPWKAYAAMDLFCIPSRWEGGPYAVLEAMACGLPVVASEAVGETGYVREGETGLFVQTDMPGAFAAGLQQLLIDPDLRELYGLAGRQRVEAAFTLAQMVEATAGVYRDLCPRAAAPDTPPDADDPEAIPPEDAEEASA